MGRPSRQQRLKGSLAAGQRAGEGGSGMKCDSGESQSGYDSSKMRSKGATHTVGHVGRFRAPVQNLTFIGYPWYIHRLIDKYTVVTYIHWLIDEYSGLCSSVPDIFLSFGTEEYSLV
jgi:hypothetical protein